MKHNKLSGALCSTILIIVHQTVIRFREQKTTDHLSDICVHAIEQDSAKPELCLGCRVIPSREPFSIGCTGFLDGTTERVLCQKKQ
jgi:hypothetical protein